MFSRSKKMLSFLCLPVDSGGSSDDEKNPENDLIRVILPHKIDRLLEMLDDYVQNEVNTI